MNLRASTYVCVLLAVLAAVPPSWAAGANAPAGVASSASAGMPPLPPIPTLRSRVQFFRDLLALSPSERGAKLADRTPELRQTILAKVQEYAVLSPSARELRLRTTELGGYLKQLMPQTPAQREAPLASLPEADRQFLASRLAVWDQLPAAERAILLDNEKAAEYFAQFATGAAVPQTDLDRFRSLSPGDRDRVMEQFRQLFELSAGEKNKILGNLAGAERDRMQHALVVLTQLPVARRQVYAGAVEKFAAMAPADRAKFLQNAERWKAMSNDERTAWRALTKKLPPLPPLPPGFVPFQQLMPPEPRTVPPAASNLIPPQPK